MRIAIATYADGKSRLLPPGDEVLRNALEERGAIARPARWFDPSIDWTRFDAVVIRSCWDYHLRLTEFLAWLDRLEQNRVVVLNSPSLIRWNADKRYLRGFPILDTIWLDAHQQVDVAETCAARGWQAAVVKPLVSASAYRTALRTSGVANGPAMVQRFLPEIRSAGEWSLMFFNGVFSHSVLKLPAGGDFRVQHEHGGTAHPASVPDALLRFATQVLACLPEPAVLARIDIAQCTNRGPVLMELEVIEPELFLDAAPQAGARAAAAVESALATGRQSANKESAHG